MLRIERPRTVINAGDALPIVLKPHLKRGGAIASSAEKGQESGNDRERMLCLLESSARGAVVCVFEVVEDVGCLVELVAGGAPGFEDAAAEAGEAAAVGAFAV